MRARINARFAELHAQRTSAETRLAALTAHQPQAADPAILDPGQDGYHDTATPQPAAPATMKELAQPPMTL